MIPEVENALAFLTRAQVETLIRYAVPYWKAYVAGPVPLGGKEPFKMEVTGIVVETKAEALEAVEFHVRRVCAHYGFEYNEDDWHLMGVFLVNGN